MSQKHGALASFLRRAGRAYGFLRTTGASNNYPELGMDLRISAQYSSSSAPVNSDDAANTAVTAVVCEVLLVAGGDSMPTEISTRYGVCLAYQRFLHDCQKALAAWQQQAAFISGNAFVGHQAARELKRLKSQYTRAYTALENHENSCPNCQYVSKIAGLDFESMSNALDFYRRTA
jgi:hypothetical protein